MCICPICEQRCLPACGASRLHATPLQSLRVCVTGAMRMPIRESPDKRQALQLGFALEHGFQVLGNDRVHRAGRQLPLQADTKGL